MGREERLDRAEEPVVVRAKACLGLHTVLVFFAKVVGDGLGVLFLFVSLLEHVGAQPGALAGKSDDVQPTAFIAVLLIEAILEADEPASVHQGSSFRGGLHRLLGLQPLKGASRV